MDEGRLRAGWRPSSMAEVVEFLQVDLFQAPDRLFTEGAGLARAAALLEGLGRPQDAVPVVHVAGTAGKGTVASGVAAVASGRGRRVGLHVSPHVYDLRERFTVDGAQATPDQVVEALDAVLPAARALLATEHGAPTFYEVTLAMAWVHFQASACDLAVVETGIGGRFDATNLVGRPDKLAVVTRIGMDHEAVLGSTLAAIADQKAGILPPGGRAVVLQHGVAEVDATLARVAQRVGCALEWVRPDALDPVSAGGLVAHQREDLALVEAVVAHLDPGPVEPAQVARVVAGLELPGRFERVRTPEGALVVLDGAHNPIKLAALVDRLRSSSPEPSPAAASAARSGLRVVFGCRRDKKAAAMLAVLAGLHPEELDLVEFPIVAGDVAADRSMDPGELDRLAARAGVESRHVVSMAEAATRARTSTTPTVVVGSFHLLAALRPHLGIGPWPVGVERSAPG